jgi:hypothetical protein
LIAWNRTGVRAGKWNKIVQHIVAPGRCRLADFNAPANKLIAFKEMGGGGGQVYSWRPGLDSQFVLEVNLSSGSQVTNNEQGAGVFADPGSNAVCGHWITGDIYLAQRHVYGPAGAFNGFIIYDDSAKTLTRARGAQGSPIIDAATQSGAYVVLCVDRANARALWAVGQGSASANRAIKLYQSALTDLWNLRSMYVKEGDTTLVLPAEMDGSIGLKPMFAANGYLHFGTTIGSPGMVGNRAGLRILRMPIY